MSPENYFFIVFLITILVTRILIYLKPMPAPTIKGFRTHHYMYGIILAVIGVIFNILTMYAIGFGLFIDELTYLILKGKTHKDNYSIKSLIGTAIFVIIIFIFRGYLTELMR